MGTSTRLPADPRLLGRYLDELELDREDPSPDALARLHERHAQRFAHDTVWMSRGRIPELDHLALARALVNGEGGACMQLNCGLHWLLDQLGYDVTLHAARTRLGLGSAFEADPYAHSVLTVELDGTTWYADVGLGSAMLEPAVLEPHEFSQAGGFTYRLERVHDAGYDWRFDHDRSARALRAVEFAAQGTPLADFGERYDFYATSSDSAFLRHLTANRRLRDGIVALNGATLMSRGTAGRSLRLIESAQEWEAVLREEFLLGLPEWSAEERDRLWAKAAG